MRKLFLFMAIGMLMSSCAALKESHEAKKDAEAVVRVYLRPSLFEVIGKSYIAAFPIPEMPPVYIKGRDTTIYRIDSIPHYIIDSVQALCPDVNMDSLIQKNRKVIYVHTTDTINHSNPVDERNIRLLNEMRVDFALEKGKLFEKDLTVSSLKSEIKKEKGISLRDRIIGGVIIALLIYFLIRKK